MFLPRTFFSLASANYQLKRNAVRREISFLFYDKTRPPSTPFRRRRLQTGSDFGGRTRRDNRVTHHSVRRIRTSHSILTRGDAQYIPEGFGKLTAIVIAVMSGNFYHPQLRLAEHPRR